MLSRPSVRTLALGVLLVLLPASPISAQSPGFRSLFDGKTLSGWKAAENPDSFAVENGELVVHGPRAHLFYAGEGAEKLRNFVFRAEVKTTKGSNSGIFIHSRFQKEGWPRHGYEVQVNTSHGDSIRSGSLYNVVKVAKAWTKDDAWSKFEITVQESWITVSIDGRVVVCHREPEGIEGTRRLGRGTFAIQAHDPKSTVFFRGLELKELPDDAPGLSRAERASLRPGRGWWDRMDYGPFHSSTLAVERGNVALKGITAHLRRDERLSMTFDTDLLRMAVGWEGGMILDGVGYNGSHGPQPRIGGKPIFRTFQAPGIASRGRWEDPRSIPHGPLPRSWGRWRGLHRHGEQVILSYEAAGRDVLELPAGEEVDGQALLSRTLSIGGGSEELMIALADVRSSVRVSLDDEGEVARFATRPPSPSLATRVVSDRSDLDFAELAMGDVVSDDLAQAPGVVFKAVPGFAPPHPRAGAKELVLPRVNDGDRGRNNDDTQRNTWLDGKEARIEVDLLRTAALSRIDTYSWHRTDRSPQNFTVYGHLDPEADAAAKDPKAAGWTKLASVDTRPLGYGGRHGSSIVGGENGLGSFRKLLWVLSQDHDSGLFISEIDVYGEGKRAAPLQRRALSDPDTWVALVDAPKGVLLHTSAAPGGKGSRVWLRVPAGGQLAPFKVVYGRGDWSEEIGESIAPADDPAELLGGGPALWPEVIEVQAKSGKGKGAYVVDDIPVPFDNPWNSYLRLGGMDFFSDGERAAVSTWNGDVWLLEGLGKEELGTVRWRRIATGLFETLGLRIVDDRIYVHGKDQISRLHDLDGDGEIDFYENFNNDVFTTRNFHEFPFDLQTDKEGNFYFSKAAPVRPGGRGFDKIVPHHGTVMRLSADGQKLEVVSTGLRAPNGVGVGPNGELSCGDNEGTWVPHCKLHWLKPGSFQGVMDTAHRETKPKDYNPPLCWFPMNVDNSGGGQVWVDSKRWGPFEGEMLHFSYGTSSIFKVMKEEVDGVMQGGVVRFPVRLGSSAMRGRFNRKDGQLYLCGLRGWQTNAARLSAVQRVRYTGGDVAMPTSLEVVEGGLRLGFTCALDEELATDPESYAIEVWDYVWGPMYGSPEVSALKPDKDVRAKAKKEEMHKHKKHDPLSVKSARLEKGGRSVFLEIPKLQPVMQMHIKLDLESSAGEPITFDIYNSIHRLRKSAR